MAATRAVEEFHLLKEMGEGLLASLYLTQSRLAFSSSRGQFVLATFVEDSSFAQLRGKIGKSFPKIPGDLSKVAGYPRFCEDAGYIIRFFLRFKHDVHKLLDFQKAALALLQSAPAHMTDGTLSMENHRNLCLLYADLYSVYVRVLYVFATCHQAKVMYSLNLAAEKIYKEKNATEPLVGDEDGEDLERPDRPDAPPPSPRSKVAGQKGSIVLNSIGFGQASVIPLEDIYTAEDQEYATRAADLFRSVFDGLHGYLVDHLAPLRAPLTSLLAQLAPSIRLGLDVPRIVSERILDATRLGAAAAQPDCPKMAQVSKNGLAALSVYEELADHERYTDFLVAAVLSCPGVLFNDAVRGAFAHLATGTLVTRLFRDMSLNLHVELEQLIAVFQPPGLTPADKKKMGKPRGLKLKKLAKQWARHAVQGSSSSSLPPLSSSSSAAAGVGSDEDDGGADESKLSGAAAAAAAASAAAAAPPPGPPCHVAMRSTRVLLVTELGKMVRLLRLSPGLSGPRLPQILALAALSKAAVMGYFRHANNDRLKLRRDCQSFYSFSDHLVSGDATELLASLFDLLRILQDERGEIVSYYAAFLGGADAEAVAALVTKAQTEAPLPELVPLLQSLAPTLRLAALPPSAHSSHHQHQGRGSTVPFSSAAGGGAGGAGNPEIVAASSSGASVASSVSDATQSSEVVAQARLRESLRRSSVAGGNGVWALLGGSVSRESLIFGKQSSEAAAREALQGAGALSATGPSSPSLDLDLFPMRLTWDRVSWALSGAAMTFFAQFPAVAALSAKMARVSQRSRFVDDLEALLTRTAEPYELCWFQNPVQHAFMAALTDVSSSDQPSAALSFLLVPLLIRRNVHVDCPGEDKLVGGDSVRFMDTLLTALGEHVEAGLRRLWLQTQALETKHQPLEAARRIERLLAARAKGDFSHSEPLPGMESVGCTPSDETTSEIVAFRTNLASVVSAAGEMGFLVCYNREYNIPAFVRQRCAAHIEARIHGLFLAVGKPQHGQHRAAGAAHGQGQEQEENLQPLAAGLHKLITGLHSAHFILSAVDDGGYLAEAVRMVLFRECSDVLLPPPGQALSALTDPNSDALVWRLAHWFGGLGDGAPDAGVVWLPSLSAFGRLVSRSSAQALAGATHEGDAETSGFGAADQSRGYELFLTLQETSALASLLGPQGLRVIESQLLRAVAFRVKTGLLPFLFENRSELLLLAATPQHSVASVLKLQGLDGLVESLVVIGMCLALRLQLQQGLAESVRTVAPQVPPLLSTLGAVVYPWGNRRLAAPLCSLANSAGFSSSSSSSSSSGTGTGVDASLAATLEPVLEGQHEKDVFVLLPVACAAAFAAPSWSVSRGAHFIPEDGVFETNHHCLPLAISTLFSVYFGADVSGYNESRSAYDARASAERTEAPVRLLRHLSEEYLFISAQVLLTMHDAAITGADEAGFADRPLGAMMVQLQSFCDLSPVCDASALHRVLPLPLLHHALLDASLGRVYIGDDRQPFTHKADLAAAGL